MTRGQKLAIAGLFLSAGALYTLTGPGRIDMIDGQHRFDVALNLLRHGRPWADDPMLRSLMVAAGRDGHNYALYAPGASLAGLPLVGIGLLAGSLDLARFLFSFTSALGGALTLALLFLFYEELGVARLRALGWTAAVGMTTIFWPAATASFDQTQQAFFALLAVYAGLRRMKGGSPGWAALSGFSAGALVLFQEAFVVVVPAFALSVYQGRLRDWKALRGSRALRAFCAAAAIGPLMLAGYNAWRFGSLSLTRVGVGHMPSVKLLGNPLMGAAGVLLSPGKSIFLFSPPTLLVVAAWRNFRRERPEVARAVGAVVLAHFALIMSLTFWGGDWCWGPRYLVLTLPLFSLALPFLPPMPGRRVLFGGALTLGLLVQLLALSVDHQRFFFARSLEPHFWQDPSIYFRDSQLFARPSELLSLGDPLPETARRFVPSPYPGSTTYVVFGPPPGVPVPVWMRYFRVFFLPRPWPLWAHHVIEPLPVDPNGALALGSLLLALGLVSVFFATRER
jgi:hypothetical protein